MATEIVTQAAGTPPVTLATTKDATCFAIEAAAVLKAMASAEPYDRLVGAACLMERISEDMERAADRFTAEKRLQWAREIKVIAHTANRMNDPGLDEGECLDQPLLYAAETLFDLTISRLESPAVQEEVQHG